MIPKEILIGIVFLVGCTAISPQFSEAERPPVAEVESIQSSPGITTDTSPVKSTYYPSPSVDAINLIPPSSSSEKSNFTLPDPDGFLFRPILTDLAAPIGLAYPQDGTNRIFLIEQPGMIQIVKDGFLQPQPFLDITSKVGSQASEQGLLGLAFHPEFSQNKNFYVYYTDFSGNTVVSRYSVSVDDPDRADTASEYKLLYLEQPYANHNGGMIAFGLDKFLYIGLGDGGSAGDPGNNGQSLNTWLGKILRLNVDTDQPYSIPADNPFIGGQGLPEIWAYGLRNPWRFSFDRLTGDLYIGDVGQNAWEEVNFVRYPLNNGINFGWNYLEGTHPFNGIPPGNIPMTPPVFEYAHDQGCSVIGGVVYRGFELPEFYGVYLFGDYCSGKVWGMIRDVEGNWVTKELFMTDARITAFGDDESGNIYLLDHQGILFQLDRR